MFLSDYHFHLISITRPLAVGAQTTQHKHTFYELGLLLSGEAIWRLEGHGDVRLVADEALLIAPEQLHSERVIKASAFAWLGFRAPEGALEGIPRYKPLPLGEWETPLRATLETLRIENACRPLEHEARMRLLLVDLLIQLRRAVHGEPLPQPTGEMHDNIEAARFYLERNATEELTMEQVARYHGFSLSHFEVLFAKRFGCTPKQYQHGIKLRRVEKSIRSGIKSPKLLADEHGFRDVAYFCRWFKKQSGLTPSAYAAGVAEGLKKPEFINPDQPRQF